LGCIGRLTISSFLLLKLRVTSIFALLSITLCFGIFSKTGNNERTGILSFFFLDGMSILKEILEPYLVCCKNIKASKKANSSPKVTIPLFSLFNIYLNTLDRFWIYERVNT